MKVLRPAGAGHPEPEDIATILDGCDMGVGADVNGGLGMDVDADDVPVGVGVDVEAEVGVNVDVDATVNSNVDVNWGCASVDVWMRVWAQMSRLCY